MERSLFFSVGEPSGDLHGANLIRELRALQPELQAVGLGGPRMADAGCKLVCDTTGLAIMGFGRALTHLPEFRARLRFAEEAMRQHQPLAVVLIDCPGFNWWVARAAKRLEIPVFYYGAPQLWAWAPWRIRKMRRLVKHVLCKLPFEPTWFRDRGVTAHYVGHPYFDELSQRQLDFEFLAQMQTDRVATVTFLPGSRNQEVASTIPDMLRVARLVAEQFPAVRFLCASYNARQAEMARAIVRSSPVPIEVFAGQTKELIELATCCVACSGSVSLELLYHRKPTVIFYRISPVMHVLQDFGRTTRYITLVNLLAADSIRRGPWERIPTAELDALPMPEFLSVTCQAEPIARHVVTWLTDETARQTRIDRLSALRDQFAKPGASQRAARYIVEHISG